MNTLKLLLAAAAVALVPSAAQAHLIDLGLISVSGNNPTSQGNSIEDLYDLDFDLTHLYKTPQNDGVLGDSFFDVAGVGATSGAISWNLVGSGYELLYVVVKGANDYHLYSVSDDQRLVSNPDEPITVNGKNGISHVNFFGRTATNVPDSASTLALLGLGLGALGFVARRRKA